MAMPMDSSKEFRISSIVVPLIAIIAGVFMVVLDNTVMNVALPKLVTDFHTQLPTLEWTVTGYTLAQAAVIPLSGWLADRFGAKTIFLSSTVLFTIGSVMCSTPHSAGLLILYRILQGLGGGSVLPVAMAYIYRLTPPEKAGAVMGMMGIPILFAPAIGPVLAGWLVQYHSWRWIFLLNLPIGLLCLLIGLKGLPQWKKQDVAGMDVWGTILGPIAFAALSYGVSEGANGWHSAKTIAGLVVGGLALALFIVAELRSDTPLLELRVFKSIDFTLAIIVQWVGQFALFGALFLIPQFLQQARGYGAFDTGLILLPQAIASGVLMPFGGILFDRIGARWLVVVGLGIVSTAVFQLSHVTPTTDGKDLIWALLLSGGGMGLMMMPLTTHLMNKAPRALVSRVTSLSNALQQVVTSLAVATLVTILTARVTTHTNEVKTQLAKQGIHVPDTTSLTGQGSANAASTHLSPQAAHAMAMVKQALVGAAVKGFDDTFWIMMFIAIAGALLGFVLRRGSVQPNPAEVDEQEQVIHPGFTHG
ncbi:DHA2 family efflux MFS transporter permease subunit [Alicyclobacillus fastidiosus]|uniref:DHA2 family efflux MFS transporter permease subunit n=1 Tax=Alicyclobacillus fastidiosus TaxID=392011 RepID=A0ABY6ZP16_9BACL|nr:DHA2 family efflux MFS transporter permease subunit [Alicyclobacillus fastidiosus]WAH44743.1 DHA2 family efflux MFS transporter permease subunit [Alicyclobacillus fastidiosus]